MRIKNNWVPFVFLLLCLLIECSWGQTGTPLLPVSDPATYRDLQTLAQDIGNLPSTEPSHLIQSPVVCISTGTTATTSASPVVTTLSCSISPLASGDTIYIMVSGYGASQSQGTIGELQVFRNGISGTNICNPPSAGTSDCIQFRVPASALGHFPVGFMVYDVPKTTSLTSYTLTMDSSDGSDSVSWNRQNSQGTMILFDTQ